MRSILLSDILSYAVIVLISLWYITYHFKRRRLYKLGSQFNGPPVLPILGNALKFLISSDGVAQGILDSITCYKSPTRIWLGPQLFLHIWDPKQLQIVLNNPKSLEKPQTLYKLTEPVLGRGLVNLPVSIWRKHRRIIAPAFNKTNVSGHFATIQKHCKKLVKDLERHDGGDFFDAKHYLYANMLEITFDAILGFDDYKENFDQVLKCLEDIQIATIDRITNKWYLPDFLFNVTPMGKQLRASSSEYEKFISKIICQWEETASCKESVVSAATTQNNMAPTNKPRCNEQLLSIDLSQKLSSDEVRNEVKTIISAAFDTTALTLGHVLLILGMYPHVQKKLYQEILEVLGPDKELQNDGISKLVYLDRVIKESIRILPTGPGTARYVSDDIQLDNFVIPAGSIVLIGILAAHRDPNIWPNPTEFDPDRFLPSEVVKRHPYSLMAFSAGQRNCVGFRFALLVLKIATIEIIKRYKIRTIYKDILDIKLDYIFLFQPTLGYKLKLESRNPV